MSPVQSDPSSSAVSAKPHQLEREVSRELLQSELPLSSLVVRRMAAGAVCLEGVIHIDDAGDDVESLVKQVSGVNAVLNHLVVRPKSAS